MKRCWKILSPRCVTARATRERKRKSHFPYSDLVRTNAASLEPRWLTLFSYSPAKSSGERVANPRVLRRWRNVRQPRAFNDETIRENAENNFSHWYFRRKQIDSESFRPRKSVNFTSQRSYRVYSEPFLLPKQRILFLCIRESYGKWLQKNTECTTNQSRWFLRQFSNLSRKLRNHRDFNQRPLTRGQLCRRVRGFQLSSR